jgi:hypothetical protein
MATAKDVTMISHCGRYRHKFEIDTEISREIAMGFQIELGYHPAGYGFMDFESTPTKTTWFCWDNCD